MKTPSTRIASVTNPIPRMAPATAMGIETLPPMKTRLPILKLLFVLCCTFATTAVFGQPFIQVLTNTLAATYPGVPLNGTTNFNGNNGFGAPGDTVLVSGSIATFDGTVPGTIYMYQLGNLAFGPGGAVGGGFGSVGFSIDLTPSQTSPVNIIADTNQASPPNFGFDALRVQSGAGQLILGDNSARQLVPVFRPASSVHTWINNSANPVIINPNVQILNGGGAAGHVINFQGTGDFSITNNLRFNNGAPSENLQWDSTGTTIWAAGGDGSGTDINKFNSQLGSIALNAGTLIVKSAGLLANTPGLNTVAHNGTLLRFDAPGQSDTMVRAISGTGPIQFNNGTWTFTSAGSTFSGSITLNGGQLIAGAAESIGVGGPFGIGGTISFAGGTLGYSANNTFDYSPRFDVLPGQQYKIDTAGQSVTFSNNLVSIGGTLLKSGNGTLTLAGANSYSGLTTVSNGTLALEGPKTGVGSITVVDNATLGIFEADGQQVTPLTLTLGTSTGALLEYDNMTNRTAAPLAAGTLASAGTQTISINSGIFTTNAVGRTNPLVSWTSGSAPGTVLGVVDGGGGFLKTNGNRIEFITTSVALIWSGINGANWTTANNWTDEGIPVTYANPKQTSFNDTAPGETNVTITGVLAPEAVTVNNNSLIYSITSSGGNNIGGSARFTKSGSGTATLSGGANSYTGVTTLKGGTLSVSALANGGSPSDIGAAGSGATNLVLKGGTLLYTGGAANVDRLFTVTTAGGTINASGSSGELKLNNTGTIGLNGVLTLTGTNEGDNTLTPNLISAGSVLKSGTGRWILAGTNTYGGGTVVSGGILQVGASPNGQIGSGNIVNNSVLVFNRTGTLTVPGAISGTGSVTNAGTGTVILANNNTYLGGTFNNAGTLQVGNGGGTGSLNGTSPITNNSLLVFNTTGTFIYNGNGLIDGPGNVIVQGGGLIKAIGANTYIGWTRIDAGSTFQPCEGNTGGLVSSVVTNNGTLKFVRQDTAVFGYTNNIVGSGRVLKDVNNQNDSDVTLMGTNTYTGGTVIAGGGVVLGDGVTVGAGSIVGNVFFTNSPIGQDIDRRIVFNHPEDVTFGGTLSGLGGAAVANAGRVEQRSTAKLTLTGNNTHLGGATIVAGTMQVGTGGTSGSLGNGGPVTDNGLLIFNRSGPPLNVGAVNGAGAVQQVGPNTVTLVGSNSYTGITTISNGMLVVGSPSVIGDVQLYGGYLAPGGYSAAIGTLTVNNLTWSGGNVAVALNRASSPSNSVLTVAGTLSYTAGGLRLANFGPALVPGDKFTIFSQPVVGGGSMPIVSPGFTVANNLAVDGSVTVTAVSGAVTTLTGARSGGNFVLSWPAALTGLFLQTQTNTLAVGLSTNWFTLPGSDSVNGHTNAIIGTSVAQFYRLAP